MIIDGIPMKAVNDAAAKHGLIPIFVAGEDESVDDEIQLRKATGEETGVAIQCSGRFYTATEYCEKESSLWMGRERTDVRAAAADAIARITSR